jgi:nucleoside-diphosphate-sugar epimerase
MVRKNILITGGSAFVGRHLVERFSKEAWNVFWSGENISEQEIDSDHVFVYSGSSSTVDAADIFEVHDLQTVVYVPGQNVAQGDLNELQHVLQLSVKSRVAKFLLLSSAEVFSAKDRPASEALPADPETEIGRQYQLAESLVMEYHKIHGLDVTIVRPTDAYGPGQLPTDSRLAQFLFEHCKDNQLEKKLDARHDFLYIDDLVYAIYQAVARDFQGTYLHVSSGNEVLNHERCCHELGWNPKYTLSAGLKETVKWIRAYQEEQNKADSRQQCGWWKERKDDLIPYIENIVGFFLMVGVVMLQKGTPVNSLVYFDVNYVYIGAMGILYGKRQAVIAFCLSSLLLGGTLLSNRADLVSIMYVPQYLLHFTSYLFVAVLTGYFADHKRYEEEAAKWQCTQQKERFAFLKRLYKENVSIKDTLYRQIINSEDSIGRLYRIIRRLDRVEKENIFTQAAAVTADVLDVTDVSLSVLTPNKQYLRQKVRLGKVGNPSMSRQIAKHKYLQQVMEEKSIFVNRGLLKDVPDLVAPILYRDEVIGVLEVYDMNLDQWNLAQQNLLSITSRLISDSIARAYRYDKIVEARKYYKGTRILLETPFQKILQAMEARRKVQGFLATALLHIRKTDMDLQLLNDKLHTEIRAEDFVGFVGDKLYILLTEVKPDTVAMVQARLEQAGIKTDVSEAGDI